LELSLPLMDLSGLEPTQREAEALRLAQAEALAPFDLLHGPLIRATLLRLGSLDHVLLLTMHHIVSDGWSTGVLLRELSALYQAFAAGKPSPLPELRIQYADFAVWQREWLQGAVLESQLGYWRKQLHDIPRLQLQTDHPRPDGQSFKGEFFALSFPAAVTARLNLLSKEKETTLFMTLLAVFHTLLHRYTSQEDIAIGSYIANRNRAETEGLIGFFINTLVFRAQLSGELTFAELLQRVKEAALGAYMHQDLPFPKLVEQLQPERDLRVNPLFQVVFHLFNAQTWPVALGQAAPPLFKVERQTVLFDLVLELHETADGLRGGFEYSTDLFDEPTIAQMARHFSRLVDEVLSDPQQRLADIPILSDEEQHQLLHSWNATAKALPGALDLVGLFERQAEQSPEATAFLSETGKVPFRELNLRVNQLAHFLQKLGVGREVMMGLCLERSLEFVYCFLAILKAGGAYVPLDPSYPKERLKTILSDLRPPFLLTPVNLAERFLHLIPPATRLVIFEEVEAATRLEATSNPGLGREPNQLAYVLYTSGSTGKPKGVAVEDRQVLNRLHWMWANYPFAPGEVCSQKTGVNFVDSLWELLGGLLKGFPTVLIPDSTSKDLDALVAALAKHQVTRIWLVPSLLRALLEAYPDLAERLPELRFWVSSGEALAPDLFHEFQRRMPGGVLYNLYGTTEVWDVTWYDPARDGPPRWRIPIGRPIDNMQAFVLDGKGKPAPIGVPGELHVGGTGLARGYLNRPDLNEQKFVQHVLDGETIRLYRTGDLVRYLRDGQLEFVGRLDHQVKLRGFRVELGEVETVLDSHPAVEKSAVLVREDKPGDPRLIGYVVQRADYMGGPEAGASVAPPVSESVEAASAEAQNWTQDKVEQWRAVWDNTYHQGVVPSDPTFNIAGFISSYTGLPIPPAEVKEWVHQAVARVRRGRPRRVLEIGCGTGLILWRVAPHCERYVGTDFSPNALQYIRDQLESRSPELTQVSLLQRSADDFSGWSEGEFDLAVLHSVAQYFPSVDYLLRVIEGAAGVVQPGGSIYIGDVRCLGLLEAFHTSVECYRANPILTIDQLKERVSRRLAQEQELAVAPDFFFALRARLPRITGIEVCLKRGAGHNEFTRFRYDVRLLLGGELGERNTPGPALREIAWPKEGMDLDGLKRLLLESADSSATLLRHVPNARLRQARALVQLLQANDREIETVRDLCGQADQRPRCGLDPDQACGLLQSHHFGAEAFVSPGAADCFDLLCWPNTGAATENPPPDTLVALAQHWTLRAKPWVQYANNPLQGIFTQKLVPVLRSYLERQLPDHMIPSGFVLIEKFPLTPSGKIDRKALPPPDLRRGKDTLEYVAPRNALEEQVALIWGELLGISQASVHDHFFADLGGHSLLATQLCSRLRSTLQIDVPLRWIFEAPTISDLTERIRNAKLEEQGSPHLQALPRDRYRTSLSQIDAKGRKHSSRLPPNERSISET
jgi:amino acid adenylation domain-containing protein